MAPGIALERKAPIACAAVENFVRDRQYNAHRRNVSRSRTTIDNTWSSREEQKLQVSRVNVKKLQVNQDRFTDIEKENIRLLARMQDIDRQGVVKAAGGIIVGTGPARCSSVPAMSAPGSRVGQRVKELKRIDAENQRLLKRLQGTKATVSMTKLDEAHKVQQKFMRMRCERQHPDWKEDLPLPMAKAEEPTEDVVEEQGTDEDAEECDSPLGSEKSMHSPFAGVIPKASQALVEELMAAYQRDKDEAAQLDLDVEAAVAAAKEKAAAAFREASAIDADVLNEDIVLGYNDVVQKRIQAYHNRAALDRLEN